jgi:aminoglycoside phosphotransferase (APT) family kinase protein
VSEKEEFASIAQVANVIRRLHALEAPDSLRLPPVDSFVHAVHELANAKGIKDSDRNFLKHRLQELGQQYSTLTFALPEGVIHGDANVGNVILDRDGAPILIDLDDFRVGPREWDLVQTALFYERFGWHTEAEYRTFVEVYGWDIMSWQGYPVLADYREISMTVWLAGKAGANKGASEEFSKRVESIRTGASRRDWAPF